MKKINIFLIFLLFFVIFIILNFNKLFSVDYGRSGSYWTQGIGWFGVIVFPLLVIFLIFAINFYLNKK